jgi:GGDEF domain-containing protein
MLRRSGPIPKTLQKLPAAPGLSEIHHYLSVAMEHRGRQVEITWTTPDRLVDFTLNIHCPFRGGDTEWKLYVGKNMRLVWDYKSCDVLLVFNLILSSCGEVHQSVQADGALSVSEAYRDSSKKRDTYYLQTVGETKESNNQPLDNSWSRSNLPPTGDLSLVEVSRLFQSILLSKMTGRLDVDQGGLHAKLFFVDGEPQHADVGGVIGDEGVLEMLTWREGKYKFEPRVRVAERNVAEPIETLVIKGVQLVDKVTFLRNVGLLPESVLQRKHAAGAGIDFAQLALHDPTADANLLKRLYLAVDDKTAIGTLVDKLRLSRSQWVPVVALLINADLITFTNDYIGTREEKNQIAPKAIDKAKIHSVMMTLRRPETGMFTYPAFLYFLEQEYFRGYRSGSPLSVMVMEMRVVSGPPNLTREPLDVPAVAEVVRRISRLKRHIDLLAHYDQYDYAMLLPNTKTSGANIFAQRVAKAIWSSPLTQGLDSSNLSLAFGVACIPDDCLDLGVLLASAEAAKAAALRASVPIALYRELK